MQQPTMQGISITSAACAALLSLLCSTSAIAMQGKTPPKLASSTGTNAKAPSAKSSSGKAAAVTTSKTAKGSNSATKSAATTGGKTATGGAKTAGAAAKTPATGGASTSKATPATTKTVTGTTQAGKTTSTKVATLTRPTTKSTVADAKAVATTGPEAPPASTGKPIEVKPAPAPAAKPSDAQIGQAVADLASGKITAVELTRQLAGGAPATQVDPNAQPGAGTGTGTGTGAGQSGADLSSQLAQGNSGATGADLTTQLAGGGTQPPPTPVENFQVVAQELPAVTETARFKAWTWHDVDRAQTDYQVPTVWVGQAGGWCESDPARIAAVMKNLPVGQRVLFLWDLSIDVALNSSDYLPQDNGRAGPNSRFASPWFDNGIQIVKARMEAFLNAFVAAGGTVDAVIVDNEADIKWGNTFATAEHIAAIEADPRFDQLASELGFSHLSAIQHLNNEFTTWNAVMGGRFDAALQTAVYDPIRARFPNAVVSNYESFNVTSDNPTPWCTGSPELRFSDGFGTHDTHSYYGLVSNFLAATRFDGSNPIGDTPFEGLRLQINRMRAVDAGSPRPMQAWIAPANNSASQYASNVRLTLANHPYYDEMLLHLGIGGCDTLLYWNPSAWNPQMNPAEWNTVADQRRVDSCLKELNGKLGQTPGAPVVLRGPGFGDQVLATGRQVGDRIVWRLTFAPGINSVVLKFMDGTTQTVVAEGTRPGAWFSHPVAMPIRMNAQATAPEMVIGTAAPAQNGI